MADYKRMISYMYQYESGVKRKNVGYARIEARNGQIKITLHMQLLGQLDSIFPTYLIQRDENGVNLIYLGDAVLKNQIMDSKLTAEENNIMNTGSKLSEMGGLLLFMHDNIFFASEWDDKPIVAKELLEALKPKKQIPKAVEEWEQDNRKEKDLQEGSQREQREARQGDRQEDGQGEQQEAWQDDLTAASLSVAAAQPAKTEALSPEGLSLAEEISMPKYKLPRGWKTVERQQRPAVLPVEGVIKERKLAEERQLTGELPEDKKMAEELEEGEQLLAASVIRGEQQLQNQQEDSRQTLEDVQYQDSEQSTQQQTKSPLPEEDGEKAEHPVAKHLFDVYPRIYPFEDNEILLCVKIEPKDIGMLPKDLWALSNNSFLMHGFYCYHHLIFAKLKDRYGCRYILGIPGIYHSRERFMARMFGFECFKSIRRRELRQGDFGYWYIDVNF